VRGYSTRRKEKKKYVNKTITAGRLLLVTLQTHKKEFRKRKEAYFNSPINIGGSFIEENNYAAWRRQSIPGHWVFFVGHSV